MHSLPSYYDDLNKDREERNYNKLGKGKGAKMKGTSGEDEEKTVQEIMEERGYELVDKNRNYYYNATTGKYVNVNKAFGGEAGEKTDKIKVNGEE
jgi:hypothetical protein